MCSDLEAKQTLAHRADSKSSMIAKQSGGGNVKRNTVLDPRRAQNVGVVLRAIRIKPDALVQAILSMDDEVLSEDVLQKIQGILPTQQEIDTVLHMAGDDLSALTLVEQFFALCDQIPHLEARIACWIGSLKISNTLAMCLHFCSTYEKATEELMQSSAFSTIIAVVLSAGNILNAGSFQGSADGFDVLDLSKLKTVQSTTSKHTLLDILARFICQEASYLPKDLAEQLSTIKKAAEMKTEWGKQHLDDLSCIASAVSEEVQAYRLDPPSQGNDFLSVMSEKVAEADNAVRQASAAIQKVQELYTVLAEYFGSVKKDAFVKNIDDFFLCVYEFTVDFDAASAKAKSDPLTPKNEDPTKGNEA
eukprot:gene4656-4849_t